MKYACTYCGDFAQMELYNEIIVKLTPDYNIANIKEFFENHPKNEILIQILDTANFVEKDVINQIATLIPPILYNYKLIINNPFDENSQIISVHSSISWYNYYKEAPQASNHLSPPGRKELFL